MNLIDKLEFDRHYESGILFDGDFHTGGVLFGVPYVVILIFHPDGFFEIKKRKIETETFPPFDKEDAEINNYYKKGTYRLNENNYIVCEYMDSYYELEKKRDFWRGFDYNDLTKKEKLFHLTGRPLEENLQILVFDSVWGCAFTLK